MCGPAMALVGTGLQAIGTIAGASGTADAKRAQADYYDRQADKRRQEGQFDSERKNREHNKIRGTQQNTIGHSGLAAEDYTDVVEDSERDMALDIEAIRWGAEQEASSLNEQAEIERAEASNIEQGGVLGAISPLINGASKAVTMGGFG